MRSSGREGALVVAAWSEPGRRGLVARVTRTSQVSGPQLVSTATSAAEVLVLVREWLGEIESPEHGTTSTSTSTSEPTP